MDLEPTMDETDVIVIDMGSGVTKIGFCGEDAPRAVIPTVVGSTSSADLEKTYEGGEDAEQNLAQSSNLKKKSFVGDAAYKVVGDTKDLQMPCRRGTLDLKSQGNREAVEHIYEHCFKSVFNVEPEEFGCLILDSPTAPMSTREWIAEMLFEKFKVKSLGMFNTAVMSLFSTGKTRGLIFECGDGITHAVPIFEGYAIPHAIFTMQLGGTDLTEELYKRCLDRQIPGIADLEPIPQIHVMQSMKEKLCEVVLDYEGACSEPDPFDEERKSFELPDGSIIQIPHDVRYGAAEILFNGEKSAQSICKSALQTVDTDFKNELMGQVVVAGGTSMLPGLSQRLRHELQDLMGGGLHSSKIEVFTDSQRKNAAWIGGSMFASLSTFEHFQITKADYDEGKIDLKGLVARKTY